MKRFLTLAAAVLTFSSISINVAEAHAELVKSYPASGDVVSSMPTLVSVEFSEELMLLGDKAINSIEITDPVGAKVAIGSLSVIQNSITADLQTGDYLNGDYTVNWKNVAKDGHKDDGSFTFTLSNPDAPNPESSLLIAPAPVDSHGVATPVLVAVGVLVMVLILVIAYRRFNGK